MEIALMFAGILLAVALSGGNLMVALLLFAASQFVGTMVWFATGNARRHGRL